MQLLKGCCFILVLDVNKYINSYPEEMGELMHVQDAKCRMHAVFNNVTFFHN